MSGSDHDCKEAWSQARDDIGSCLLQLPKQPPSLLQGPSQNSSPVFKTLTCSRSVILLEIFHLFLPYSNPLYFKIGGLQYLAKLC